MLIERAYYTASNQADSDRNGESYVKSGTDPLWETSGSRRSPSSPAAALSAAREEKRNESAQSIPKSLPLILTLFPQ
ncbi:MAG: hypothetical protein A3K46_05185 [Chloroflexi bacterium RBG_13_60_9]|nr:MAG: hypothetical protein A3K46_05185 [Chloroflexi bacterium RBG_13_60_9]